MPHLFIHNNACYNRCYVFYIPFFNAFSIAFSIQYPIIPWLIAPQVSNGIAGVFSVSAAFAVIKYSHLWAISMRNYYIHIIFHYFHKLFCRFSNASCCAPAVASPDCIAFPLVQLQFFFVPYSSPPVDFAFTALYKVILPVINP